MTVAGQKLSAFTASPQNLGASDSLVGVATATSSDYRYTPAQAAAGMASAGSIRTKLLAATTITVNPSTGNDATGSLTSPFATFVAAVNWMGQNIDTNNLQVTFQGVGTAFTESIQLLKPWIGGGNIVLDFAGGTLHTLNGPCVQVDTNSFAPGFVTIQNVDLASANNHAVIAQNNSYVTIGAGVRFGSCPSGYHVQALDFGLPLLFTPYTIYGGAVAHIVGQEAATYVFYFPPSVTLTGTPAFSTAFAWALRGGFIYSGGTTFSGSATGIRFITDRAKIDTGSSGLSYFPGSIAGVGCGMGTYDEVVFGDDTAGVIGGPFWQNAVNDAAAQAAGVPVGALYRNGSVVQMRVS